MGVNVNFGALEKSIWILEKSWKFVSEKGYRNPEQWWLMTTWNKQSDICTILETCHSQFVGEVTKKKLPRALPVYKFVFKLPWFLLEDFLGGIIIMLLKFTRLLCSPDILWNHASWSQKGSKLKEEILRSNVYIILHLCLTLLLWKFRSHVCSPEIFATSTCCSLSFRYWWLTSVLEFLRPFFWVTVQPMVAQTQRSCLTLNLWVPP